MIRGLVRAEEPRGSAFPDSLSVADVISSLASQSPAPDLCWVVKTSPYDFDTAGLIEYTLSSNDGPAVGNPVPAAYRNRVVNPFSFEISLPGLLRSGAVAVPAFGEAKFRTSGTTLSQNRDLDVWAKHNWTDREYLVYVGAQTGTWPDDFVLVFKGATRKFEYTHDEGSIFFRDLRSRWQVPIQTNLYAGTGGLEGDDSIKGKPKPLWFGQRRQVTPILVDSANQRYQLHDGQINSVQAVRDQGGDLNFDADYADITTATPAAGEYATSLATGFIALGDSPAGTLTVDAQGDAAGGVYAGTVATIVRRISVTYGGLTDPDDLEVGSFVTLDADAPYSDGIFIGTEERDVADVIGQLLEEAFAYAIFTPTGRLRVGRVDDPATQPVSGALTGADIKTEESGGSYSGTQASAPTWRVRLPFKRYHQTLNPDNVDAGVSEANRQDFGEPWRFVSGDDATLKTAIPSARAETVLASGLDIEADAQTEADRIQSILATERRFHTIELDNIGQFRMFSHLIGRVETLTDDIYELTAGDRRLIFSIQTNPAALQTLLTLWG